MWVHVCMHVGLGAPPPPPLHEFHDPYLMHPTRSQRCIGVNGVLLDMYSPFTVGDALHLFFRRFFVTPPSLQGLICEYFAAIFLLSLWHCCVFFICSTFIFIIVNICGVTLGMRSVKNGDTMGIGGIVGLLLLLFFFCANEA